MPDSELKRELSTILADRAFQPRSDPRDSADRLGEYLSAQLSQWWQEFKDRFLPELGLSKDAFDLPDWMVGFFQTLGDWALVGVVAVAIGVLIYICYRLYLLSQPIRIRKDESFPISMRSDEPEETRDSIDALFREGRLADCLIALRRRVRRQLLRMYHVAPSLPDRKLIESVMHDDVERGFFEETARCYERCILAGDILRADDVQHLLTNLGRK